MQRQPIAPPVKRAIYLAVGLSLGAVVLGLVLWFARYVFLLIFAGMLLAIFLRSLANWVAQRTPVSRGWSLALVVAALCALTLGALAVFGAQLAQQYSELVDQLPQSVNQVRDQISEYSWGRRLRQYLPERDELPVSGKELAERATTVASALLGAMTALLIVGFLGLFFATDPQAYLRGMRKLVPPDRRDRADEVLAEIHTTLQGWLLGKAVSMTVVAVATTLGLQWLGVPLPLALGTLAGLLAFIPNIGPIISVVPAALLAASQRPIDALWVGLLYLAIQTAESYVLTPMVQRRAVSLPPGLIIAAQVLLGLLLGSLGLVLATPLTATAVVLVRMLYVEDALGDHSASDDGGSSEGGSGD